MIELPEAIIISRQLNQTVQGKTVKEVVAGASPHKFAFYYDDPAKYPAFLQGRTLGRAVQQGGRIEIEAEDSALEFNDGTILHYYEAGKEVPAKHQLHVAFEDGSSLVVTVAMYGGLFVYPVGAMDDNFYYTVAKEAISPLSDAFDYDYFHALRNEKTLKKSAKAFLATEQRIPGLGNGVLQDILLNAKIHPKKKMNALSADEVHDMFESMKSTLQEMVDGGGRDTERDLFGNFGSYKTKLSKNNKLLQCPNCGGGVKKEAYLGGSIYYCDNCQSS